MTRMEVEARETPERIHELLTAPQDTLLALCAAIKKRSPVFAATIARGSSDHAALFAKYALETRCGLITASLAPSVHTRYAATPQLRHALVIAISQSGKSPDIVDTLAYARNEGALTVAIVNDAHSPLALTAEFVLPMFAGSETAVAATKSYIASLVRICQLVATLTQERALTQALERLPETLYQGLQMPWHAAIETYLTQRDTFTLARGYGLGIAFEAALKFKETNQIHAEGFSSAEVMHGPLALITKQYPLLLFTQHDHTQNDIHTLLKNVVELGATPLVALPSKHNVERDVIVLPTPAYTHPMCDPIVQINQCYVMLSALAVARGLDPDHPPHLQKVTKTR